MTFYSIPTLVTALLSFGLGIFILARNRASRLNWTFGAWCLLTCYWQTCWTILFNVEDHSTADLLARLGYSGIIFIPIVFFHFVVEFTADRERLLSYLFYVLGGLFTVSIWTTSYFVDGIYRYSWGYYPRAGILHVFYFAVLVVMLFSGIRLLWRFKAQSQEHPTRLNQTKYSSDPRRLFVASIDFLANYGLGFYPLGLVFTKYSRLHNCLCDHSVPLARY